MMKSILFAVVGTVLLAAPVFAATSDFAPVLRQSLKRANSALAKSQSTGSQEEEVIFKQFWLTIRPKLVIGVSSVVDVEVAPEITFQFEKYLP